MTSERTADADLATLKDALRQLRHACAGLDGNSFEPAIYDEYDAALDRLAALVAQHRPPTVRELQDVIANHVRNLEPVATSHGVAQAVHAFLTERKEAMQNETRPPSPGEYVDPQPAAVDVAGDEREHILSKDCWCNPTVSSIEDGQHRARADARANRRMSDGTNRNADTIRRALTALGSTSPGISPWYDRGNWAVTALVEEVERLQALVVEHHAFGYMDARGAVRMAGDRCPVCERNGVVL